MYHADGLPSASSTLLMLSASLMSMTKGSHEAIVLDEANHPLLFQLVEDTEKSSAVDAQFFRQGISAAVHYALMCDGAQEEIDQTVYLPGKLTEELLGDFFVVHGENIKMTWQR